MHKIIFNTKEVAKYLNCSISLIRSLVRKNRIPYFKTGRILNFDKSIINLWITVLEIYPEGKDLFPKSKDIISTDQKIQNFIKSYNNYKNKRNY